MWTVSGVLAAVIMLGAAVPAAAAARDAEPTVVVYVRDTVAIPTVTLMFARVYVCQMYRTAGVRVAWVDQWSPDALMVSLVGGPDEAALIGQSQVSRDVLGFALEEAKRAVIFYDRIVRAGGSHVDLTLAHAIAHELGHLLLPHQGHSSEGIMRPALTQTGGRRFTAVQSQSMRDLLNSR